MTEVRGHFQTSLVEEASIALATEMIGSGKLSPSSGEYSNMVWRQTWVSYKPPS